MLSVIVTVVIVLLIVGICLWLLGFLPVDPQIHQIIRGVIIIGAVIYVLVALLSLVTHHSLLPLYRP